MGHVDGVMHRTIRKSSLTALAIVDLMPPAAFFMGVALPGFAPCGVVLIAGHRPVCALIQSRTSPTRHAVTLSDNLNGLGNVPAATLRHNVGAEKGRGAGVSGRFGLCTSCDSRMNALAGSASKTDGWMVGCCAGMPDVNGVLDVVDLFDMSCRPIELTARFHTHKKIKMKE